MTETEHSLKTLEKHARLNLAKRNLLPSATDFRLWVHSDHIRIAGRARGHVANLTPATGDQVFVDLVHEAGFSPRTVKRLTGGVSTLKWSAVDEWINQGVEEEHSALGSHRSAPAISAGKPHPAAGRLEIAEADLRRAEKIQASASLRGEFMMAGSAVLATSSLSVPLGVVTSVPVSAFDAINTVLAWGAFAFTLLAALAVFGCGFITSRTRGRRAYRRRSEALAEARHASLTEAAQRLARRDHDHGNGDSHSVVPALLEAVGLDIEDLTPDEVETFGSIHREALWEQRRHDHAAEVEAAERERAARQKEEQAKRSRERNLEMITQSRESAVNAARTLDDLRDDAAAWDRQFRASEHG